MTVHAIPPCNCADDTPAIVQAIANAQAGDTISFNAGNFTIAQNATITLKGQILYTSTLQNNQIVTFINGGAGVSQLWAINGPATGITISNLAFSTLGAVAYTGAISIVGNTNGDTSNIVITNCIFNSAPILYSWLQNSQITYNTFENIGNGSAALGGWYANNVTFSNNLFENNFQDISLVFGAAGLPLTNQGNNVIVSNNVGAGGTQRMAIEIQGNDPPIAGETRNLKVSGNYWTNWNNALVADGNSEAYSIVPNGGTGTVISGNYADGTTQSGGAKAVMAMEVSGTATVQGNDLRNFGYGPWCYGVDAFTSNNLVVTTKPVVGVYSGATCNVSGTTTSSNKAIPTPPAAGASQASTPPMMTPPFRKHRQS